MKIGVYNHDYIFPVRSKRGLIMLMYNHHLCEYLRVCGSAAVKGGSRRKEKFAFGAGR